MGWTGTQMNHSRPITAIEAITEELGSDIRSRILATAKKGKVIYAAVRDRKNPDEVWGLVLLAETRMQDGYRWLYTKAIDETMGPAEDECPARILDLLTPTKSEYALQWRERCREQLARPKPMPGQRVVFTRAMQFSNGRKLRAFTYVKRNRFRNGKIVYSIPNWRQRAYSVKAASR